MSGARGPGGPGARGPAPRVVAGPGGGAAKLDEILARLARIEAKLDGRAGGPPRGEWRGPRPPEGGPGPRPEGAERGRRMMGERMGEGGPRPEGRPHVPEEIREQMRKRMEEGRERMEQAREKFREMEERIRKLEAEIERLRADR